MSINLMNPLSVGATIGANESSRGPSPASLFDSPMPAQRRLDDDRRADEPRSSSPFQSFDRSLADAKARTRGDQDQPARADAPGKPEPKTPKSTAKTTTTKKRSRKTDAASGEADETESSDRGKANDAEDATPATSASPAPDDDDATADASDGDGPAHKAGDETGRHGDSPATTTDAATAQQATLPQNSDNNSARSGDATKATAIDAGPRPVGKRDATKAPVTAQGMRSTQSTADDAAAAGDAAGSADVADTTAAQDQQDGDHSFDDAGGAGHQPSRSTSIKPLDLGQDAPAQPPVDPSKAHDAQQSAHPPATVANASDASMAAAASAAVAAPDHAAGDADANRSSTGLKSLLDATATSTAQQSAVTTSPGATHAAPSATAGASSAPAPAPAPEAQFAADNHPHILAGMQAQLLPNGGTMHLRLDPPELGALQVTVHMRDGVMTASFQTSNDDATNLLSHSLSQLKHALETQGVNVERLHVQQSPRDERSSNDGQPQHQTGSEDSPARQEQQRREMLRRMWRRLTDGSDPLDMVA